MKNEISSHLVTSRDNLAPKNIHRGFPVLELIKYSGVIMGQPLHISMFGINLKVFMRTLTFSDLNGSCSPSVLTMPLKGTA